MKNFQKHSFEAVSLLTADNGMLEVSIVPALGQPSWLVPTSLILDVVDYDERIWTFLWNGQEVSVYHLIPSDMPADKLVILEGNTDVHRLALQTMGELETIKVRISDVKDVTLDEEEQALIKASMVNLSSGHTDDSYLYQAVEIHGELYVVPDLDLISHHLVDLDG